MPPSTPQTSKPKRVKKGLKYRGEEEENFACFLSALAPPTSLILHLVIAFDHRRPPYIPPLRPVSECCDIPLCLLSLMLCLTVSLFCRVFSCPFLLCVFPRYLLLVPVASSLTHGVHGCGRVSTLDRSTYPTCAHSLVFLSFERGHQKHAFPQVIFVHGARGTTIHSERFDVRVFQITAERMQFCDVQRDLDDIRMGVREPVSAAIVCIVRQELKSQGVYTPHTVYAWIKLTFSAPRQKGGEFLKSI